VDLRSRTAIVCCADGDARILPFDFLVVATGMQPNYFGHDEFARYAPGLKTLADAEIIRAKILSAYEWADATDDTAERLRQMTFIVAGAGPAGVELAASLAEMAAVTLRGQYRRIDPAKSSIILVEGGTRILPSFAEKLGTRAARRLEKLGVKIMTGTKVEKVDENGVVADGKQIPSATVLWTAGVSPSPIVKLLGGKTDRAGRVSVGPYMNLEDVPGVFVIGDASSVVRNGRSVPGVAQARDPAGTSRRPADRAPAQGAGVEVSVPLPRQGQHGGGRQELRHPGERVPSHEWLRLPGSSGSSFNLLALPQLQNRLRVQTQWALVLFHRPAQFAIDPRTAKAAGLEHDGIRSAVVA